MELYLIIAGIALAIWLVSKRKSSPSSVRQAPTLPTVSPASSQREQLVNCSNCGQRNRLREVDAPSRYRCGSCRTELPNPFVPPARQQPEPDRTFRPSPVSGSHPKNNINFRGPALDSDSVRSEDLDGMVDAFTGVALNPGLGLYQCTKCRVYYHRESYEVIQSENGGKCVACPSTSIRAISQPQAPKEAPATGTYRPREAAPASTFQPDSVTLANYREHAGRVVSFTGSVIKVVKSQSGKDYAIMFEDKDWCDGFKMVIFRGNITAFGGGAFLKKLAGRQIFARGLLQKHPRFGYQLLVSEPSMFWRIT